MRKMIEKSVNKMMEDEPKRKSCEEDDEKDDGR